MGRYTIARSAVSILFFYGMNALSVSVVDYLVVVVLARGFQIFGHRALPLFGGLAPLRRARLTAEKNRAGEKNSELRVHVISTHSMQRTFTVIIASSDVSSYDTANLDQGCHVVQGYSPAYYETVDLYLLYRN
jgi:hypothetical protein